MAGDLNPSFTFDIGQGNDHISPWEFSDALAQATAGTGTTIDDKIQRQLKTSGGPRKPIGNNNRNPGGRDRSKSKTVPIDQDDDDDDSDDEPLPGEIDPSSEEEEEEKEEEEEEEEEEEDMEDEDSEDEAMEIERTVLAKKNTVGFMDEDDSEEDIDDDAEEMEESDDEEEENVEEEEKKKIRPDHNKMSTAKSKGGKAFYDPTPQDTTFSTSGGFSSLHLSRPLLKACESLGYTTPTPIQAACIPLALTGRDICGSAVTGSGKTAAFTLPLLERLLHRNRRIAATYVLILTPTRELAAQVHSMVSNLAKFTDIRAALVVGGLSLQAQAAALRSTPEIVVATPGRLIDHLRNTQSFGLEDLQALVLDEADRLLELGFAEEIKQIVSMAPSKRQTMLFSATMTEEVQKLISLSLKHPVRLAADAAAAAPRELTQEIVRVRGGHGTALKEALLLALSARTLKNGRTIVFFSTKQNAHRAKILYGLAGLPPAGELHGDMTQAARLESLEKFRQGQLAFLLATDVAARGLDILGVETVVNYDAPRDLASYLHRVGRTARAGKLGKAITFVEDGDRGLIKQVMKKTAVSLQARQVPNEAVSNWQGRIEALQPAVERIKEEEREERALRKAEMEAQKAENMVVHGDEIYSRPARTWFQTATEKKALADASKIQALGNGYAEHGTPMTKKQQKAKEKNEKRSDRKLKAAKDEVERKKKRNMPMEETNATVKQVKAVKAREAELKMQGVPSGKAGRMAAAQVSGVKKKKKVGKKELFGDDPAGGGGGGGDQGVSKVYSGGAKSGQLRKVKQGAVAKSAMNSAKRQGKGKHAFKSKAKHRRR